MTVSKLRNSGAGVSPVWRNWGFPATGETPVPLALTPILVALVLLVLVGCNDMDGPRRYRLSGSVTYDGKPVPAGIISLEPDTSLGNSGPGTLVEFTNGRYRTTRGKGTVGGPHLVRIVGHDGKAISEMPLGRCLFQEYRLQVDLPRHDAAYDFDVPDDHHVSGKK